MIWVVMTAIALLASCWIVLPCLRNRIIEGSGGDATISIYADQIDEVERDLSQGLITGSEARAAIAEIEARPSSLARNFPGGLAVARRSVVAALAATSRAGYS